MKLPLNCTATVLFGLLAACHATNGSTTRDPFQPATRVAMMIQTSLGDHRETTFIERIVSTEWPNAAFMHVLPNSTAKRTYATPDHSPEPLLVLVGHERGKPATIGAVTPSQDGVIAEFPPHELARLAECDSTDWVSAFLINGMGYVPKQPIIIKYGSSADSPTLRVDPIRNVVQAKPFFTLKAADMIARGGTSSTISVQLEVDRALPPSLLLVLEKIPNGWDASGTSLSDLGRYAMGRAFTRSFAVSDKTSPELYFYLFRDYSVCGRRAR